MLRRSHREDATVMRVAGDSKARRSEPLVLPATIQLLGKPGEDHHLITGEEVEIERARAIALSRTVRDHEQCRSGRPSRRHLLWARHGSLRDHRPGFSSVSKPATLSVRPR